MGDAACDGGGPGAENSGMKTPHLLSATAALALVLLLGLGFARYAQRTEDRYIHAIAPMWWFQKTAGGALQRAALRQPDLLLIYGSSEFARRLFQHGSRSAGHLSDWFYDLPDWLAQNWAAFDGADPGCH